MKTDRFLIKPGSKVKLARFSPADTHPWKAKSEVAGHIEADLDRLFRLQELLYAEDRWSLLLVIQAMDAAGKDSAIKHVMRGLNPQGTRVASFKAPSTVDLDHDFLWRIVKELPGRGEIGVFNRSHYEEVLVVRVHPDILAAERLPDPLVGKQIWRERFDDINAFERHLARNGTVIRKIFLHVSEKEQRERFLARLEDPSKNWKFSAADVRERACWDDYMTAYSECLRQTSTPWAPWHVIPADRKWFTRRAVAATLCEAMRKMKLAYPKVDEAHRDALRKARAALAAEKV